MSARNDQTPALFPSRVRIGNDRNNGNKEPNEPLLSSVISGASVVHARRNQAPEAPSGSHWIDTHRAEIEAFGPIPGEAPQCMVVGCTRTVHALGICKAHYLRARRAFDATYSDLRSKKGQQ